MEMTSGLCVVLSLQTSSSTTGSTYKASAVARKGEEKGVSPYSVKRSLPSIEGALQPPAILTGTLSDCNVLSEVAALTRTRRVSVTLNEFDAKYVRYCKLALRRLARPVTIRLRLLSEFDARTPMSATSSPMIHAQLAQDTSRVK